MYVLVVVETSGVQAGRRRDDVITRLTIVGMVIHQVRGRSTQDRVGNTDVRRSALVLEHNFFWVGVKLVGERELAVAQVPASTTSSAHTERTPTQALLVVEFGRLGPI